MSGMNVTEHMAPSLAEALRERYAMPDVVNAALQRAGAIAAKRLLDLMENDAKFESLTPSKQVAIIERVLDRVYGKSDSFATAALVATRAEAPRGSDKSHLTSEIDNLADKLNEHETSQQAHRNSRSLRGPRSPQEREEGSRTAGSEGAGRLTPASGEDKSAEPRRPRPLFRDAEVVTLNTMHRATEPSKNSDENAA